MQTEARSELEVAAKHTPPRRRAATFGLILILIAVGARAANGTFSRSSSVGMSATAAGTVSLTEGTNTMTVQMDLYPSQSAKRVINLTNGSLVLKTITVTPSSASFGTSSLDDSITYTVDRCSQAWTGGSPLYDYSCGGSTTAALSSVALDTTQRSLTSGSLLTANGVNYYMFTFTLGTSSPAAAYGQSLNVTFTFTATQRDGQIK